MWVKEACILTCLLLIVLPEGGNAYKVVCYLGSWANYRQGDGKFLIEHIDPNLCTHVIYGFAKLDGSNRIAAYDPYLDLKENWGLGAFERFNNLKNKNPQLKTLIAIGGWNEGSVKYSNMAKDPSQRKIFVDSCLEFLKKYNFDGLDMDWEYPADRGGAAVDKENFVTLLKELKEALAPHRLLLTAAVSAGENTINVAYDIPGMAKYLDFINLMAYDLHGSWEKVTGHHAGLYARPDESANDKKLNVDYAVKLWMERGTPKDKLILGMGTYGRSFTLNSASNNGLGAPASEKGAAGPITREGGMLGYNEICSKVKDEGWTAVVEEKYVKAPYAYKDRQWVGYDDQESIRTKTEYVKEMNLGGAMIWSLETDDFRGKCHGLEYPLLSTINKVLGTGGGGKVVDETDQPVIFTPKKEPTVAPEPKTAEPVVDPSGICPREGMFKDPDDCTKFYQCVADGNSYRIYNFNCSEGTAFHEEKKICVHKNEVPSCGS